MERKKVIRILIYEGEVDWLETTLSTSRVKPTIPLEIGSCTIREFLREEMRNDGEKEGLGTRNGR